MDNAKQLNKAIEYANRAKEAAAVARKSDDEKQGSGNWEGVIGEYSRAIQHFSYCIKYEKNPALKKQ